MGWEDMKYTINVTYCEPYSIGQHRNVIYDRETKQISFTKEGGTVFENKQEIHEILNDILLNRNNYKQLVNGSTELTIYVKRGRTGYGYTYTNLTVAFDN